MPDDPAAADAIAQMPIVWRNKPQLSRGDVERAIQACESVDFGKVYSRIPPWNDDEVVTALLRQLLRTHSGIVACLEDRFPAFVQEYLDTYFTWGKHIDHAASVKLLEEALSGTNKMIRSTVVEGKDLLDVVKFDASRTPRWSLAAWFHRYDGGIE